MASLQRSEQTQTPGRAAECPSHRVLSSWGWTLRSRRGRGGSSEAWLLHAVPSGVGHTVVCQSPSACEDAVRLDQNPPPTGSFHWVPLQRSLQVYHVLRFGGHGSACDNNLLLTSLPAPCPAPSGGLRLQVQDQLVMRFPCLQPEKNRTLW